MKAFSIAVAVTLVLAFVSQLESASVPLGGGFFNFSSWDPTDNFSVFTVGPNHQTLSTPGKDHQRITSGVLLSPTFKGIYAYFVSRPMAYCNILPYNSFTKR
ncbi:hypothetical protein NHX12_000887 [Muraenolepis orangiensis]|uniref:Uncharacterized protein n=1 Tax=Muraenolepis orangiensis TaxID=630683 RepID=A0A9Q0DZP5_9TELE|nr:hypothetical protein NHX12_000887 [Muraenolepis orangiensis]